TVRSSSSRAPWPVMRSLPRSEWSQMPMLPRIISASASMPAAVCCATAYPARSSKTAPAAEKMSCNGLLNMGRLCRLRSDEMIHQRIDGTVDLMIGRIQADIELVLNSDDQHQGVNRIQR